MTRQYQVAAVRKFVLVLFIMLILQGLGALQIQAQTTGTIYGAVSDSNGAAINGATVTVQNLGTNLTRTSKTDAEGGYNFPLLPVGRYGIAVKAQGFKSYQQKGIELPVETHLRLDLTLEVGQVTEEVLVTSEAAQIDLASSALGKVVEQRRIVDLPLNGRNFLQLGVLQAGVVPPIPGIEVVGSGTNRIPGGTAFNFSVNGMRISSNNHLLDGISNVEPMSGSAMIVPSPDALQEFRILTSLYSAEFGRSGGSIVTVITKGGGNGYHGSAYEFLRNDKFDARNFFAPLVPALKQNQFGATFGGPLILPRFGEGGPSNISAKGQRFFFVSYEGYRQSKGYPVTTTVPSLLTRQGDFSQETVKPRDPLTGLPFPGGIIPQNRIDPVARKVLTLWPEPNLRTNNWTGTPAGSNDRDQFMARIDHTFLGGRNNLTGRYLLDQGALLTPTGIQGTSNTTVEVPGFAVEDANRFQNLMLADTHVFSEKVTNEFRASYSRAKVDAGKFAAPQDASSFGFTYPIPASGATIPAIAVSGYSSIGYNLTNSRVSNFYEVVDNVAINEGKHSFKFGGDIRHTRVLSLFPSVERGGWLFNGGVTGNALADVLLGRAFTFIQVGGKADKTLRQTAYYFYGQDDFRVSKNLTLNLGLRYELVPGFTERDNELLTFIPGVQSVLSPTLPKGILRPGDPGVPRTLIDTAKNDFGPRVGLAWDPFGDGKTSIRTGYGLFYDESALVQTFTVQQPPDVQAFALLVLPPSFGDPYLGNSPFKQPLQFPFRFPVGSITWLDRGLKLGRVQHWNLTLQRQLSPSLAIEVAYVGNKGSRLQGTIDPNQSVWNPAATRANINARRPFQGIGNVIQISSIYDSNYNGLQTTLTQRLSHGLSFQAAYTWSKAIDDITLPSAFFQIPGQLTRPQNSLNVNAERGLAAFDVRHRFVASYIYELPFFSQSGGAASYVLGGWRFSGILALQSGTPFTVVDTLNPKLDADVSDRTDLLRDPNLPSDQRTPNRWFDTTAFRRLVMPNYGNAGRNIVFTDGIVNFDFGLAKEFKLGEQQHLKFRWEVFNAFNHPNFGVPVNDFNSPNFGRVLRTGSPERQMQFALKFVF